MNKKLARALGALTIGTAGVITLIGDTAHASGTVTITAVQFPSPTSVTVPEAVEGAASSPSINATFTDTNAIAPSNLFVSILYGDGTVSSTNQAGGDFDPDLIVTQVGGAAGTTYTVTDVHTFGEESPIPTGFVSTLAVHEVANVANSDSLTASSTVVDAPIGPEGGCCSTASTFTGGNTGNVTTASQALADFETGIGGTLNTAPAPQSGGFRTITWDGVKTDGTDLGGPPNTTSITSSTVAIPTNRFQTQGATLGQEGAVSSVGFTDVNLTASGLFPAFSSPNTFAPFNTNSATINFAEPSPLTTTPITERVHGFGAVFLNVQQPGTSIEFFSGPDMVNQLSVPTNATAGAAVFAGELFPSTGITSVTLTLGAGTIFSFDGTNHASGGANTASNNEVALDNVAYSEPTPRPAASISAPQGVAFSGSVARFIDLDPNGGTHDFTAQIDWGDGASSTGTITPDGSGGFNVNGTHTYATKGAFDGVAHVADFGGASGLIPFAAGIGLTPTMTTLTSNHTSQALGSPVTFTAHVSPASGPTGSVSFFLDGSPTPVASVNLVSGTAALTTSGLSAGPHSVTATYNGDGLYAASSSNPKADNVTVSETLTGSQGSIVIPAGTTALIKNATAGSVSLSAGAAVDVENSNIASLVSSGAKLVRLCSVTTTGSIDVHGSTGFVLVGDAGDDACGINQDGGSLTLQNNTGGVEAINNHVTGSVINSGNSGTGAFPEDSAPDITGNGP